MLEGNETLGKMKRKMEELQRTRTGSMISNFVVLHIMKFMNTKSAVHTFMSWL